MQGILFLQPLKIFFIPVTTHVAFLKSFYLKTKQLV